MAVSLLHATVATGTDAGNGSIHKAEWNQEHAITMATSRLLGRTTAGTGAVEEISAGAGLTLTAGVLDVGSVSLTTGVTGTLPVGNGGTGVTTLTGIVKGNGTSAFTAATANTDYVTSTGADGAFTRWMFQDTGWDWFDQADTNTAGTATLNYTNGSVQRWAPTGTRTLATSNWPPSGNLGELLIEGVNLGAATITWPTINWILPNGTTTTTFGSNGVTLQTSGTDWVFLWTRDAGTTIYGKVVR